VKKTTAFWDASALVPLCIEETGSRSARTRLRKFAPVVWWGTFVEIHSALCRLHVSKEISELDKQGAVNRLQLLGRGWREILPHDIVPDLAIQMLDQYSLRAADSLQLAASLFGAMSARRERLSFAHTVDWRWPLMPWVFRSSRFPDARPPMQR